MAGSSFGTLLGSHLRRIPRRSRRRIVDGARPASNSPRRISRLNWTAQGRPERGVHATGRGRHRKRALRRFEGKTTGTPILIILYNKDAQSSAYNEVKGLFRPGTPIIPTCQVRPPDWRGSGRASAGRPLAAWPRGPWPASSCARG
jgi:hypothetical protein